MSPILVCLNNASKRYVVCSLSQCEFLIGGETENIAEDIHHVPVKGKGAFREGWGYMGQEAFSGDFMDRQTFDLTKT